MNTLQDAHFDGETYKPLRDKKRLKSQMLRVFDVMKDGKWRSLQSVALSAGAPEASVSARLRDLRKPKFGGFKIRNRCLSNGQWLYRMEEGTQQGPMATGIGVSGS